MLSDEQMTAYQLLGAVKAGRTVSRAVSAEAIRTLQAIRDEKLYLHFNGSPATFDEFMDKHPDAPMSYYQFHQREELLSKEGPLAFQLLNTLRIPASKRKLLTAGEVNVTEDHVEINGERFSVTNSIELRKLIVGILDEKAEVEQREKAKDQTIEKGRKDVDKYKRTVADLKDQLANGGSIMADATPHARALVSSIGNLQMLAEEIKSIDDPKERKRFAKVVLERLAAARHLVEEALGFQSPKTKLDLTEQDINELIDSEG
jgi:hypothetical protein